jgi:prepilin-type N-terminal cleavage/methylation domain-containing protein
MLRIGNRAAGFTLIEVMVATAVLSFSIVLIYQAFFISLDSFNYCLDYLDVVSWADELLWQTQESLTHYLDSGLAQTQGEFIKNDKKFAWVLSQEILDEAGPLYKINLDLLWRRGKKEMKLSRTAYAVYESNETEQ